MVYREIVLSYGLWDQLRIDKGKEWYLSLFINEALSSHRNCTRKPPHVQTTSKKVNANLWNDSCLPFYTYMFSFIESYH